MTLVRLTRHPQNQLVEASLAIELDGDPSRPAEILFAGEHVARVHRNERLQVIVFERNDPARRASQTGYMGGDSTQTRL